MYVRTNPLQHLLLHFVVCNITKTLAYNVVFKILFHYFNSTFIIKELNFSLLKLTTTAALLMAGDEGRHHIAEFIVIVALQRKQPKGVLFACKFQFLLKQQIAVV